MASVNIGESSRSLSERVLEHVRGAKALDKENFIAKPWALQHMDRANPPRIRLNQLSRSKMLSPG